MRKWWIARAGRWRMGNGRNSARLDATEGVLSLQDTAYVQIVRTDECPQTTVHLQSPKAAVGRPPSNRERHVRSQPGVSLQEIDASHLAHTPMSSKGWIFIAGVVALALSLYLWFTGSPQAAIFVGLWVPSLWILADLVAQMEKTQS